MRKNFGAKPYLFPQPVMIIGTYEHAIIGTREENPVISGVSELVPFSF